MLGQNGPKIVGAYGRYTGGTPDGTVQHMPNATPFRSSQEQVLLSFFNPRAPPNARKARVTWVAYDIEHYWPFCDFRYIMYTQNE